jgi:glutaredoxin
LDGADGAAIRVRLLTSEGCKYCDEARALLQRLAWDYPLAVEEVPADGERGRALALEHGVLFPPGIFVEGEFVQYGRPSERKLRARLTSAAAARAGRGPA